MSRYVIHDHVKLKNFATQLSRRVELPSLMEIDTKMKRYHPFMSRDLNTLKVIKALVPKIASIRSTHFYRPGNLS